MAQCYLAMDGIPFIKPINCTTQHGVIHRLAEALLNYFMPLIKVSKCTCPSRDPQETPVLTGFHMDTVDCNSGTWPASLHLTHHTVNSSDPTPSKSATRTLCGTML